MNERIGSTRSGKREIPVTTEAATIPSNLELVSLFEFVKRFINRDSKEGEIELFANEGIRITMVLKKFK